MNQYFSKWCVSKTFEYSYDHIETYINIVNQELHIKDTHKHYIQQRIGGPTLTRYENETQKAKILKEILRLFYCKLIQLNFELNMLSIGQICKEMFIRLMMSRMTSQEVWMIATDKHVNQFYQNFCDLKA